MSRYNHTLSRQERWLLRVAPSGDWDALQIRGLLPPTDSRSRATQAASLSRTISRLVRRGYIQKRRREKPSARGRFTFQIVRPFGW